LIWLTPASSVAQGLDHCNRCGDCCRFPCLLTPEDLPRIAEVVGGFSVSVTRRDGKYFVSPVKDGEFCSFYKDGCSSHEIKPAGGRDFECWNAERTAPEREARFAWTETDIKRIQ
jgi:Fe-S-cluster containining protein